MDKCIVCGNKLSLFNKLIGSKTCSMKCDMELNNSKKIDYDVQYPDSEYCDYEPIEISLNEDLFKYIENNRPNESQNSSDVFDYNYDDDDYLNDDFDNDDDCSNDSRNAQPNNIMPSFNYDVYNNPYEQGMPGYDNHWDNDSNNDNDF